MLLGTRGRWYAISLIGAALICGWAATSATAQRGNGRIAFVSPDDRSIYSVRPDGQGLKLLFPAAGDTPYDPRWSPDGSRIAFALAIAGSGTFSVNVMDGDGGNPVQLTDTPNFSENPNWSPDGARIVFDSDRVEEGDLEIYSMKADGTDVRRLTNNPALDALPAYSPDGKRIVFVSDRLQKDSRRLFTMSSTGAKPKRVVAGEAPNFQMVPDWQPLRSGVRERRLLHRGHRCLRAE